MRPRSLVGARIALHVLAAWLAAGILLLADSAAGQGDQQGAQATQQAAPQGGGGDRSARYYAAAAAVGLGCIGAAIAVATAGSAAVGGIAQNPDIFGRALVLVGLAEGIAIYGLIVAFMILVGVGGGG